MIPRATYRLQFHAGFTFAQAERIVPYLHDLGISHIYASPVTTAQPGSMHGYDVVDPTRVNPELGGEAGLVSLVRALRARDMGLIIDIVPNHMSVTGGANLWWNDVLAHGRESEFAHWFDIDWSDKILLPFLGSPAEQAVADGDLKLERRDGRLWIIAYGHDPYPVRDEDQAGGELAELIGRQHYHLADWRTANENLNWRRFFTITGLAGIRVEDEAVFEATHALYFRLHREGLIDGVRVDHVDGLTDPAGYCRRLRDRLGAEAYIVVEKILGTHEQLRENWGVDGTSGYDFMEEVAALLHDPAGERPLTEHWARLSGRPGDFAEEERLARRQILDWEFEGQLAACAGAFGGLADTVGSGLPEAAIRGAISALLEVFPVYRTYGDAGDAAVLDEVRRQSLATAEPEQARDIERILDWLDPAVSAGIGERAAANAEEARRRFRQLSAPIAAKAVEDTAFYRYGRLLSRNDVGFDAARFALAPEEFHRRMSARAANWPHAMLTTATHDHKRGEDVRARLAVLGELADEWVALSQRWRSANRASETGVTAGDEYIFYQMLVGAWPDGLGPDRPEELREYRDRLLAWMEKAVREAKLRSSWASPDEKHERVCHDWVTALMDPDRSSRFLAEAAGFVARIAPAGEANALVQTFLRCTAPGVPDCYQGAELADLSLVDPDNRRPVDFGRRRELLGSHAGGFDAAKQRLIARLLNLRREDPEMWSEGNWEPIEAEGERAGQVLAFVRRFGSRSILGAVALRCARVLAGGTGWAAGSEYWGDTRLAIEGKPAAADLFARSPVALASISGGRLNPLLGSDMVIEEAMAS